MKEHEKKLSKGGVQNCRSGQPAGAEVAFTARFYSKETQAETAEAQLIPPWEKRGFTDQ